MATIAITLKAKLCPDDIDTIHRVPTKKKNQENIVVKLISRTKRDEILQKACKQRLLASTLGYESNEPMYVNEHLCPENKVLLGKTVQKKREMNWTFAWVSQGKILMRKTENSRVLQAATEEDLAKVN